MGLNRCIYGIVPANQCALVGRGVKVKIRVKGHQSAKEGVNRVVSSLDPLLRFYCFTASFS